MRIVMEGDGSRAGDPMPTPVAATLHVSLESAQVYRVLYTVNDASGGSATPYGIHGQETLRELLTQCEIAPDTIDVIITRVDSGMSYVLDLGHLDKATVASVLLRYAGA